MMIPLDELKDVMHVLRHECMDIETAKDAIPLISAQTAISEERVREILIEIGKSAG